MILAVKNLGNSHHTFVVSAFYTTVDNCLIVGPTFFLRPSESDFFQRFYVDFKIYQLVIYLLSIYLN